jgi:hypothetical protein
MQGLGSCCEVYVLKIESLGLGVCKLLLRNVAKVLCLRLDYYGSGMQGLRVEQGVLDELLWYEK